MSWVLDLADFIDVVISVKEVKLCENIHTFKPFQNLGNFAMVRWWCFSGLGGLFTFRFSGARKVPPGGLSSLGCWSF